MPRDRAGARSRRSPASGELAGVIDLTTSELTDFLTGGVYSAGDARLTAAGAAGVPQVVVPGCLDFTNWWVGEVPERYRQREFFQYNVEILLMRTNAEEFAALGQLIGERLSAAKGPVRVLIPRGGWSALTGRKAHDLAGARAGRGRGRKPIACSSRRSRVIFAAARSGSSTITSTTRRSRTPASMS